jgi:hypothetical protein
MKLTFIAGLLLTGLLAGISWRVWGREAQVATAIFGLLATAIQLGAIALMQPVRRVEGRAALPKFMARWGAGMGLRFLGVVALAIAAATGRNHFPALPTALGFLGVLLPLLVLEVKLIR